MSSQIKQILTTFLVLSVIFNLNGQNSQLSIDQLHTKKSLTPKSNPATLKIKQKGGSANNHQNPTLTEPTTVNINPCSADEKRNWWIQQNPQYAQAIANNEAVIQQIIKNQGNTRATYNIPVVVHVLHVGEAIGTGSNISDAQVLSAIDNINDAFSNTSTPFSTYTGVNTDIQFCLAQRDPNGDPTTGILRTDASGHTSGGDNYGSVGITSNNEVGVKALSKWPNTDYYNVWVVAEIDNSSGAGTQGYAYFPGAGSDVDGSVMLFNSFGYDPDGSQGYNLKSYTNRNVTFIHESGHYLNLYHTFEGDGGGGTCPPAGNQCGTGNGDCCADTPPHQRSNSDCVTGSTTCHGAPTDDHVHNFLDYSSDACQTEFTADQASRMQAAVSGPRGSLLTSDGCNPVNNLDAGIMTIVYPNGTYCGSSVVPVVTLKNYGSNTLTSCDFIYNIDGGTNQNFSWTGSLANNATENVTLNSITATAGAHTFYVTVTNPNGGADEYTPNDASSVAFTMTAGNGVNLEIYTDDSPWDIYWELMDSNPTQLYDGGQTDIKPGGTFFWNGKTLDPATYPDAYIPYDNTTITESFCLADGCYDFYIYDDWDNGINTTVTPSGKTYQLTDNLGNVLALGGAYTTSSTNNFCVYQPSNGDDAGILTIVNPANGDNICSTSITPVVTIKNNGTNTLTSATIYYGFDGGTTDYTYSWTGSLATGATENVTLTAVTMTSGSHTMDASTDNPNGTTDVNTTNDAASQITFALSTNLVTLEIYTDQYGNETYWDIVDGGSNVVAFGGNPTVPPGGTQAQTNDPAMYGNNITVTENLCLADDCFDFILYDDWGDGINGSPVCKLIDVASTNTIFEITSFGGTTVTENFCLPYTNQPVVADFVASATNIPRNSSILYTDLSTGAPVPNSWNWNLQGGTPATSTDQHPIITYNTVGVYNSSLTADNGDGPDSEVKPAYITVYDATGGACDTIHNLTDAESPTYYSLGANGYLPGTSAYGFFEYADKMTTTQGVVQKLVFPVFRADGGAGSSVTFKVWDDDGGFPNNELTTETVLLANLAVGSYNTVEFTNPPNVSGTFYVGVELTYGVGDTVIFGMAPDRGAPPATAFVNYLGNWNDIDALFGGLSSSIDFEAYLSDGMAVPSFTASPTEFCAGDSVFLDASSSYNAADYYWDLNGDFTLDVAGESMWVPYGGGSWDIKLYTVGGCKFDSTGFTNIQVNDITYGGTYGDVSCAGGSDGFVTVTPSGDGTSYSYNWSDGQNTSMATGLAAGVYTFTITDDNTCEIDGSVTISEPTPIVLNVTSTDVTAFGASDGTASAAVSGGTTAYTYSWSNGGNTASINGLSGGVYCVTVTDALGCSDNGCVTVTEPAQPLSIVTITSTDETCDGLDGTASVTVSGGVTPYTYAWDGGGSASTYNGLANGTYGVTITDNVGSTVNGNIVVNETSGNVSVTASETSPETCTNMSGAVSASATNGTAPYTYVWDDPSTTAAATVNGLATGMYSVTATDANGCKATSSVSVTNDPGTLTASASATSEFCSNGAGSVTATASNGNPTYTYAWSNGPTSPTQSGLSGGTYTVTVTDTDGCMAVTATTVANDPGSMTANASATSDEICTNMGGAVTASASNGAAPYTYTWSEGSTGNSVTGLAAGVYSVTITDQNSCEIITNTTVTNDPSNLSASASATDEVCGNGQGSVTVTATNGTASYNYLWSNGNTNPTISNLSAVTLSVTVTDANGCEATASTTVSNDPSNLSAAASATDETCNNGEGTATATATNGTAPYTYAWNNSGATATITGLSTGSYAVTITDNNGCTATASASVSNDPSNLSASASATDEACGNGAGTATVVASNGTAPYSYNWSNSGNTATISSLSAGNFDVTVTDSNGCQATASATVNNDTGTLNATASATDETCGNGAGTASVNITGGATPYTQLWNTGDNGTNLTNLSQGAYTVTVTDNNGCSTVASTTVNDGSGTLAASISSTDEICGNGTGTATVNATGGTPAYGYNWSPGGSTASSLSSLSAGVYTVTVNDQNNCQVILSTTVSNDSGTLNSSMVCNGVSSAGANDGSSVVSASGGTQPYSYTWSANTGGATGSTASGLSTGNYFVTVTDANGCVSINNCSVSVGPSCNILLNVIGNPTTCGTNTGSADAFASNGTAPYTYLWDDPASQTSSTANNLGQGTYNVTVTDNTSCSVTGSVVIGVTGGPTVSITSVDDCGGGGNGTATASATGGTGPYTYAWSNGQNTATATNLTANSTYTVTVTDNSGCSNTGDVTIGLGSLNLTTNNTQSCNGADNGTATVSVVGGSGNYSYSWSNNETAASIAGLAPGTYTVTVTDNTQGCSNTASVVITSGAAIQISTGMTVASCGQNNGTATATPTSGSSPYTYNWNDSQNQTGQTAVSLVSGEYSVTVTDASGCQGSTEVTVFNNANLNVVDIITTGEYCPGDCSALATLSGVSGGSPSYSYQWNDPNNQTGLTATNLCAGEYTVTVTDATGCKFVKSTTIVSPDPIEVTESIVHETCEQGNGSIALSTTGGTGAYSFSWSNGNNTGNIANLSSGTYSVTVSDARNCFETESYTLVNNGNINATINVSNVSICEGSSVTLLASGGTTYNWVTTGETTSSIVVSTSGTYNCYVGNGVCTDTVTANVGVFGVPSITVSTVGNNQCPGQPVVLTAVGASHYDWSTGATSASITVYPMSATTYSVTGYDYEPCGTTTENVIITPDPTGTTAIATADNYFPDAGVTVTFDGSTSNADSYGWDFDGDGTTDATGAVVTHSYSQNGIYNVVLTTTLSSSSCVTTDTIQINVGNVGIDDLNLDDFITIYPNPTSNNVTVELDAVIKGNVRVNLLNNMGQLIHQETLLNNKSIINLTNYPTGVYYIRLNTNSEVITKKITLVK